jgi:DNA polymerase-3 subunit delta'
MSLADVIGQDSALNVIRSAIKTGRVGSAYLFQGLSGTGKLFAAVNFAKALNCQENEETGQEGIFGEESPLKGENKTDSCDNCESCKKIDAEIHPDVIILRPTKKPEKDIDSIRAYDAEKSSRGNREIKVKQIRLLEEALSLSAYNARYKAAIIEEAELMRAEAANAFLKTLEEPPQGTVIILVTASPERLPDTVRSRCLALNFKPLPESEMEKILGAKCPSPEERQTLIRLSMSRPGLALSGDLLEKRKDFMKALSELLSGAKTPSWADREDIMDFIEMCALLLRDALIYKITRGKGPLINTDISKSINSFGKGASEEDIIDCYGKITALRANLVYNPNKSILWNYMGAVMAKLNIRREAFSNA